MARVYSDFRNREDYIDVKPSVLKERFLHLFPLVGHVSKTLAMLGINPRTYYHWKQNDVEFAHNVEDLDNVILGMLEDEAFRRGVEGVDKPVFYQGTVVGYVKEYSDALLQRMLAARAPQKYGKQISELTGPNGQPLNMEAKIVHVHSNIPLASSEEEVEATLPDAGSAAHGLPATEDIDYVEVQKRQDEENLDAI